MSREWKEYKLDDVIKYIVDNRGKTPPQVEGGYELIETTSIIGDNKYPDYSKISKFVNKEIYEKWFRSGHPSIGDILISTVGANIGNVAIMKENRGCIAQNLIALRFDRSRYSADYLYYILSSREMQTKLKNLNIGSAQPSIKVPHLLNISIKLPPLKEQKAIAHILSTLDEKIEVNNQINKKLEEMAQTIFKHWFVDFEFPNENGEPYKSSGGEMVESELGMIPKGWEVGILNELIDITSGKRPTKRAESYDENYQFPLVGASSIMGYSEDYNFNEPVLVIGRVGTHGVVQRFNRKIWASDNTLVITSNVYEYIYQILKTIDYTALDRGSTQPLITQTDIKNYSVLIPKKEVLIKYEKLIGSIFVLHSNNCDENYKLVQTRDTLLPKLMSGELRVALEEGDIS